MKEPFEKIRIIDLEIDLTQPSHEAPGFRRLYLKLSGEPPREWVNIFEQKRRFPRHPSWRKAWIVGAHIVVECVPEELEQSQLNHLKEDVAEANKDFLEWAAKNDAEILRQLRERAEARNQLEKLRTRLKFD
jgi:hypothetical protein